VKPLLEAMGTTIHHCGAGGTGTRDIGDIYIKMLLKDLGKMLKSLFQDFNHGRSTTFLRSIDHRCPCGAGQRVLDIAGNGNAGMPEQRMDICQVDFMKQVQGPSSRG